MLLRHALSKQGAVLVRSRAHGTPRRSTRCRVTNLGDEKPKEEEKVRLTQRFMRDGVPLADSVTEDMLDAVRDESINQDDMDYWFRDNPEDIQEERFLEPLEEIENTDFTVKNESWDSKPIDTLRPGDVRDAEIIGIHLYHGAVVDLGTQFHGLIPVTEEQWPDVLNLLPLEGRVRVRVHAVRDPHFFRFPVQLEVLAPDCSEFLTPPGEWEPKMTIRPDMDPLEVIEKSGRDYEPATYVLDSPEDDYDPMLEKLRFKDRYGPAAEEPLDIRAEKGELTPEEQELWEAYESADEAHIMDVDTLLAEEALSRHLYLQDGFANGFPSDEDPLPIGW